MIDAVQSRLFEQKVLIHVGFISDKHLSALTFLVLIIDNGARQ